MKHTTTQKNETDIIVVFSEPTGWVNYLTQSLWMNSDLGHVSMFIHTLDTWFYTELTWDGQVLGEVIDWDKAVLPDACRAYHLVCSEQLGQDIMRRAFSLQSLNLSWSNWLAVHAFLNEGRFPSLTCVSYIWYILNGNTETTVPDVLEWALIEYMGGIG